MKTVVLGVTGCVAIYKACEIVRGLQKAGVRVKVVMTEHATNFINPTLFRALTREPVAVGLFDDAPSAPIHHISLAQEADLFLVAPCTANVIGKMANGIADDLLSTTAMATAAPICVAPAMNVHMYESSSFQANLKVLRKRGVSIVDSESGYLACGDVGKGRLADPDIIVKTALDILGVKRDLEGMCVLVTAGPTQEPIDAVRFISNPSSGKTGFALARAAAERGAQAVLVSGPVALSDPDGVEVIRVTTAQEMYKAVDKRFGKADIAVFTAAVSDFRPSKPSSSKLKKGRDDEALATIELVKNPDILASMGAKKANGQVVVGFAAETEDMEGNALKKLVSKSADIIVGNYVSKGRAFGTDDNEVVILTQQEAEHLPMLSKDDLANRILDKAIAFKNGK